MREPDMASIISRAVSSLKDVFHPHLRPPEHFPYFNIIDDIPFHASPLEVYIRTHAISKQDVRRQALIL